MILLNFNINEFALQKYLNKTIHIDYTKERAKPSKIKNLELPYSFDLRCVKVILPNGNTEILAGNGFCGKGVGVLQPPFAEKQGSRKVKQEKWE